MRARDDLLALIDFLAAVEIDHLVYGEPRWGLREIRTTEEHFGVEVE